MSDQTKREQQIEGLRELADFLDANPNLPVGNDGIGSQCIRGDDDDAGLAQLQEIADILGASITGGKGGGSYDVVRKFGAVAYRAFYVPRESMRRYNEEQAHLAERRKTVKSKHDNGFRAPEVVAELEREDPTAVSE